jgi:uncharacterized delta-60 repeat protein
MRKTYRSESKFTRRVVSHLYKSSARLLALAIFSIHLLLPGGALAAQGDLDVDFGIGGIVTTNLVGNNNDFIKDMVTLPDGRIVVVGYIEGPVVKFALGCYTANGSLAPNFGQGGIVTTQISDIDRAVAVAIQGNKIIVLGRSFTNVEENFFSLARYDANGNLDPTFGNGGIVRANLPGTVVEGAADLAVQNEDGKIVVVGSTAPSGNSNLFATRYLADGSIDSSFGIGGIREISYQSGNPQASAVAIHNGKVIIGGNLNGKFLLTRLDQNGFDDLSFNAQGTIVISFPNSGNSILSAIAVQADGKIVLAGTTITNQGSDFAMSRVSSFGFIDGNFGNQGRVVTDFDGDADTGEAVTIQADGKIVVVGRASDADPSDGPNAFAVARYNPNGSLDQGFNNGGKIKTPFNDFPNVGAVVVKNDGNLVVAGQFVNPANSTFDFALVSYIAVGPTFDIIIKHDSTNNDATNRYLKINSVTGAYQFSDCDKGIFAEGIGSVSVNGCKLNFGGGGQNSSLSALVNSCTKKGNATVIVMMEGVPSSKTYQLNDTDITNNPSGCP